MRTSDTILDEIHEIRRRIYEETRDLTPEERSEYYKKKTGPIIKEYGMKVVPRARG